MKTFLERVNVLFSYIIKRFLSMLLVIFIVITVTFFLMHLIPGGPFSSERALPESVMQNITERYHLNDPIHVQYFDYLGNIVKGDLGPSFKYEDRTVNQIIEESFFVSVKLGVLSIFISLIISIPLGIISALLKGGWADRLIMMLSTVVISAPNFILASLLIYLFSLKLGLLPAAMFEGFEYMILPAFSLAGFSTAFILRLVRTELIEVLQEEYILTAKAKGLSMPMIIYRHCLKNIMIPVISYLAPQIAAIFTGSFVIETMFSIPGLGRHFVTSVYNRDYTVILGLTIFYSAILLLLNFISDLICAYLDPRIALDSNEET
ncbi:ABC transporter permease [Selenomonadales bacterium OttesenSCG-928-I06]|nr:ABC transporter permease [Selenomonadales bacterium OttesenSCG-928-I06]